MKLYHLFPDLMNLYGDYGSLTLLRAALSGAGLEPELVKLAPGDTPDLSDAALIYMGPGTEPARDAALTHLRPLADQLKEAMDRGTPMLFTGNAWLTLGRSLTNGDGKTLPGLGLMDFTVTETWDRRYTGDAIARSADPDCPPLPAVGFLNKCDRVEGVDTPLFTLEMGEGNLPSSPAEGARRGSLLCTHLIGPLLVKNPHWLRHVAALLGAQLPQDPSSHAQQAYQVTLDALRAR